MCSASASTPIPLLDLKAQLEPIRHEIEAAVARVLDHGRFILGPEVNELEERLAEYCQTKHAIACASGSDALLIALMAIGVQAGDEVVTTPYTFFATAGSIARLGARPVFVDIEPDTYNMDPRRLQACLESLNSGELGRVKAIIPVHLFGQCADMEGILGIAGRYGIPVIDDAAQAIGAEYNGRRAGSMGLCGSFSFYPSKNLGCMGDGGALTTNDGVLAEKLRILRVHGAERNYYHRFVGLNSRLDTLQAAVLLVKLRHLDHWIEARQRNAEWYRIALRDSRLRLPTEALGRRHVYNQFVIRTSQRDQLMKKLKGAGIGCEVYYPVPLHLQECFRYCGYKEGDFPESETAARESLAVPVYPELEPASLERTAELLRQ